MKASRQKARQRRHLRVRKKIVGTAQRPRMCVYRSLRHVYVQLVDDHASTAAGGARTLCAASTRSKEMSATRRNDRETAKAVGQLIARKALEQGIEKVVFDRGGLRFHGRVKALADGAREAGLQF